MHQLIWVIAGILIAGAIVYALDHLPGIDPSFKQVAKVVIIVFLVIWVIVWLAYFLTGSFPAFPK